MKSIQNNDIVLALNEFGALNKKVESYGILGRIYKWLTGYESKMLLKIAQMATQQLDELEQLKIKFKSNGPKKVINDEQTEFKLNAIIDVSLHALAWLKKLNIKDLSHLEYKCIALTYRMKDTMPPEVPIEKITVVDHKLKELTTSFKKESYAISKKGITEKEEKILDDVIDQYPDFVDYILTKGNEKILKEFHKWTIQNNCPANVFIEFPHIQKTLKQSYLASRIGVIGNNLLKVGYNSKGEKDVTLSFITSKGQEDVSILNEDEKVKFSTWKSGKVEQEYSLKEIWEQFVLKNDKDDTPVEMFYDGITLFNTAQYDGVDFTTDNEKWYEDLPVYKVVTSKELEALYGKISQNGEWLVTAKSASQTANIGFNGHHAFLEIAVPDGKGNFRLYPFGKYPKYFPTGAIESLVSLGNTVEGHIIFDQNVYYTMRNITSVPFVINAKKGEALMKEIKADVKLAKNGKLPFQIINENNCAGWVESKLNQVFKDESLKVNPSLFKVNVLAMDAPQPFGILLGIVNAMYFKVIQNLLLTLGQYIVLGPTRGLNVGNDSNPQWKTVTGSSYWKSFDTYHPKFQLDIKKEPVLVSIANAAHS